MISLIFYIFFVPDAVVAVLQFQNRLYESQKLTLYLYINIEVFLGYGNSFRELQHCNNRNSECRVKLASTMPSASSCRRSQHRNSECRVKLASTMPSASSCRRSQHRNSECRVATPVDREDKSTAPIQGTAYETHDPKRGIAYVLESFWLFLPMF